MIREIIVAILESNSRKQINRLVKNRLLEVCEIMMQQVTPDVRIRIKIYDRRMHAIEYGQVRSNFEVVVVEIVTQSNIL